MSDLDYQRWVAEALLTVVPRAIEFVAERGLPEGHALYVSFDTRDPGVELDQALAEQNPELMTVVLEQQFWDLATDDSGFSVVLAFGGRRRPLFVPWSAVRAFADPPAEFAFDTTGQVSRGLRRLVGEVADEAHDAVDDGAEDQEAVEDSAEPAGSDPFARAREGSAEAGTPAGEVVPFARPQGTSDPSPHQESEQEEE